MRIRIPLIVSVSAAILSACTPQINELDSLIAQGGELFNHPSGCQDCHGTDALGETGPAIDFGPTPAEITLELQATPEMAEVREDLGLDDESILAIAVYIRDLTGVPAERIDVATLRNTLDQVAVAEQAPVQLSERIQKLQEIEDFSGVLEQWERRAGPGSLMRHYEVEVIAEFEPGEPAFEPEPGTTYFYENTGTFGVRSLDTGQLVSASNMQVVVGNAETREIIAFSEMPDELRGAVHGTALSPDGRYAYIVSAAPPPRPGAGMEAAGMGAPPGGGMGGMGGPPPGAGLLSPATILKVDALTLQPVSQLDIGGRMHHAQIFQSRYMLFDTFFVAPDGLSVFLFDPETDEIIGGVTNEDLGGNAYTVFTDNEYIYALMETPGYGYLAAQRFTGGQMTGLAPSWVAKIDPETWEVVAEFPHPGFRADWICFDGSAERMFIPATGASNITALNTQTGEILWTNSTGPGPYGCAVNADSTEVWVADKGEATGVWGRTVTVLDAQDGSYVETLLSGYEVDHILLDPTGTQFWLTANREGSIYVFDANTRERLDIIEMPNAGSPHGLVWVHYDVDGNARVVADQGGFVAGIDPRNGAALNYAAQ